MRVCLVSSNLHAVPPPTYGGVEGQMALHAAGLAKLGHEVHVLTVENPRGTEHALPGVAIHPLGESFEGTGRRGVVELARSQFAFAQLARARVDELAPDVVHWHSRYPCLVSGGGLNSSRPWVSIYHAHNWKRAEGMEYPTWSPRRAAAFLGARADRRVARGTDHVIGVSRFVRSRVLSSSQLPADRVSVMTNLIDPARFAPAHSTSSSGNGSLVDGSARNTAPEILFVGRLAAEKGVDTLIRALPGVLRDIPEARLTIIGPSRDGTERGGYADRCRALVTELGLDANVHFAGEVPNDQLPERIHAARVLAVPSVWGEPCGVVVLEGLACGVPVVASRVGGIPELIENNVTGRLCPPGDPEAWSRGLLDSLRSDELQASSAQVGPARIAERHTWERVGPQLVECYERTVEARRTNRRVAVPVGSAVPGASGRAHEGPSSSASDSDSPTTVEAQGAARESEAGRAPIKVLFALTSTAGGAGEQAYQLSRGISRDAFDMTAAFGPGYPLDDEFDRLGITVRRLSLSRKYAPWTNLRGLVQMYRMMRREQYDILCTSCSIAGFFGRIAGKAAGIPSRVHVIQVYASRDHQPAFRQWMFRRIERFLDSMTTNYVAVSGAVERFGVDHGILPANKVQVIYNAAERPPVSPTARDDVRRDFGIPLDAQVVGTLGRYEPQKGLLYFLRAAGRVSASRPGTHFLVVGDGPLRGDLETLAAELGISDVVHFTGWRTDVPELLSAMDVFCLASLWETFGIAIAEAMLAGLPAVASRVDGIPEVVADGETGFLVAPQDVMGLADRLTQLLEDSELARRFGEAGRQRAQNRFSVDAMVAEYERFFRRLVGRDNS